MATHPNPAMNPRPALNDAHFDVAVIGGGINGVAIARECARAGRSTLLVEQDDFAAGTTSRSTRIIHGGLRYLEHGDLAQVRESLRARRQLLEQYPYLVRRLEFLLALSEKSRRSALAVRAGLWLYRRMGAQEVSGASELHHLEELLDGDRPFSIFSFDDAQCEFPERLVAEWLMEAVRAGCMVRNHAQVLSVEVGRGKVSGLRLRDQVGGTEESVRATWIINATGPWADQLCERSSIRTEHPMVGGVRGSHIVLRKFAGAPEAAVYSEAVDGRPFFVIPWNEQLLVGTTEVGDTGDPGKVQPSAQEIEYLLRSVQGLYPRARVSAGDVGCAFAGVRPLPYSPGADLSGLSRRHSLHDHSAEGAAGMVSVIGGKLTTAASLARECVALIGVAKIDVTKTGVAKTGVAAPPLQIAVADGSHVDDWLERKIAEVAESGNISRDSARGLVEWYGQQSLAIASAARNRPELQAPLCPHTNHMVAEAVHALTQEFAVTLGDVLLRRVPVALGACWSLECSREASGRVGAAMGWGERRTAAAREEFESERERFLRKPAAAARRSSSA
ncbi:MAG: glycerol-3-phosphate dehydrogenase/oxidase [Terriglobales bacterium]